MAHLPKRFCSHPGCPNMIDSGTYCPEHQKATRQQEDRYRGSANERGYDSRWQRVRMMKLKQDPLCERCIDRGRTRRAALVHHIKPIREGGAVLEMSNLQSLCEHCHITVHRKNAESH